MLLQHVAQINWTDDTTALYKRYLKSNTLPASMPARTKKRIQANIAKYKLTLVDDTLVYSPLNVKIVESSRHSAILTRLYNDATVGIGKGIIR